MEQSSVMTSTSCVSGGAIPARASAVAYTPIETAKLYRVDPQTWPAGPIAGKPDGKITGVNDLVPWKLQSDRVVTKLVRAKVILFG